jgi:hypothetical protein
MERQQNLVVRLALVQILAVAGLLSSKLASISTLVHAVGQRCELPVRHAETQLSA